MNVLLILIPIALGLGLIGLAGFLWALKSGQFEDLEGEAARILFDDAPPQSPRKDAPHEDAPHEETHQADQDSSTPSGG